MTIEFGFIPADDPERWNAALAAMPHGWWHTWPACHALESPGGPIRLCVARDDGGVLAAAPVAVREWRGHRHLYTPAGFSGFAAARPLPADFAARRAAFAAARGYVAGYFALHPRFAVRSAHAGVTTDNELFLLDLRAGADAVLARADRSVRRAVRAAGRAGTTFVTDRALLTRFVRANYASCLRALGATPSWSDAALEAMCADPAMWLVGVDDGEGLCAVHTFAIAGDTAEFHLNLSIRDGRAHTTAMIDRGLRDLCARGIAWANLGGGMARGDELARAKLKFRPVSVPLERAREVYRPDVYAALCREAGVDPAVSRWHPAYAGPAADAGVARPGAPTP